MKSSNLLRAALAALTLVIAACSSTPDKDKPILPNPFKPGSQEAKEKKLDAEQLYKQARLALDSSDFSTAISRYGQIAARFPFTEYATQADLERVYALYRSFQPDESLGAADKFLKEHPRHPSADYVQYIKGLVNTTRDEGFSGFLGLDSTKEDVSYLRRAFDDFSLLAQKYPDSRYAGDARQHMIDLRNRIAQHDMHVVRYYVKRGAFIAAAKRAEQIVSQYPGAPVTIEAMQILEQCYRTMGLNDQADDAHKLLEAQLAMPVPQSSYPPPLRKPGLISGLISLFEPKPPAVAPPPAVPAAPAAPADNRNWFQKLFNIGNKGTATPVAPAQPDKPAASGDQKMPDAGGTQPTATDPKNGTSPQASTP
jgi:outer membrane protein assembly factor BamD